MPSSRKPAQKRRQQKRGGPDLLRQSRALIDDLFLDDFHAQTLASLKDGVAGVAESGSLGIHAIGRGLAAVRGLVDKHAVKQVDRLLGNEKIDTEAFQAVWTARCIAGLSDIFVALDWTEFDTDGHSMLVLSLQTSNGRATPLVWKTVPKAELKGQRNQHEDDLLVRFRGIVPRTVQATVVADRGFADQKLYHFLVEELGLHFIIRFRGIVHVENAQGERRPAKAWLSASGRLRTLRDASLTADRAPVAMVVLVHERGMKEPWCLATSRADLSGAAVKKRYGRRFTCEEAFRDIKDLRFGLGMKWQKVTKTERRDRLMLLAVLALHLLSNPSSIGV